jgi:UDP-3-O-[3-hydroxymyristoyl] N-acetylglucosamine deacetylase
MTVVPFKMPQKHAYTPPKHHGHHRIFQENQATLARSFECKGIGVHSAKPATLSVFPEKPDTGIYFVRTDISHKNNIIPAAYHLVTHTQMSTVLTNKEGVSISTVEHLMAALEGCGVHNARIEVDGPEMPIMDGSSEAFVACIRRVGLMQSMHDRKAVRLFKKVRVSQGESWASLTPALSPALTMHFDFHKRLDKTYAFHFDVASDSFDDALAKARTLGFYDDAEKLWAMGLAKGSSLENTVVIKDNTIMNPEGLRFDDEMVRHKVLDAIGDLALAGHTLLGHYESYNGGHGLNNQLLHTLFSDTHAYQII